MSSTLKVAVIGVGYLGRFHAEKFFSLPEADLFAVCDHDLPRAKLLAASLGCSAFSDYRELAGKVDAVSIVTPTVSHYEIAQFFIEQGVAVFLEKPMTSTLAQANDLVALAKHHNTFVQVGFIEQFNPALVYSKPFIESPLFVDAVRIAPFSNRSQDIDVVLDLMIHDINLVCSLVRSSVNSIHACSTPVLSRSMDIASVRLTFASGCTANLTASRISLKSERRLRVFAKQRYVTIDLAKKRSDIYSLKSADQLRLGDIENGLEHRFVENGDTDSLLLEIRSFVHSILNQEQPKVTGEDGRNALDLAFRIKAEIDRYNDQYSISPLIDS